MQSHTTNEMRCPFCSTGRLKSVPPSDGSLECDSCGRRSHEKIEERRDSLEELAETDSPAADLAELLVGKDNA